MSFAIISAIIEKGREHGLSESAILDFVQAAVAATDKASNRSPRQERNARYYEKKKGERLNKTSEQDVLKASESVLIQTTEDSLSRARSLCENNIINNTTTNVVVKREAQAKGSRLPPDWQPRPEDCGENARTELPKFRDYWLAVPGAKGVKLDWDATWRNWQRNARPVSRAGPSGRKADAYSEIFLELNNLSPPHDPFADYAPEYEFGGEPAGNVRRIGQGR